MQISVYVWMGVCVYHLVYFNRPQSQMGKWAAATLWLSTSLLCDLRPGLHLYLFFIQACRALCSTQAVTPFGCDKVFPPQWVRPLCLLFDLITPVSRQNRASVGLVAKPHERTVLHVDPSVPHSYAACGLLWKVFFISGGAHTAPSSACD